LLVEEPLPVDKSILASILLLPSTYFRLNKRVVRNIGTTSVAKMTEKRYGAEVKSAARRTMKKMHRSMKEVTMISPNRKMNFCAFFIRFVFFTRFIVEERNMIAKMKVQVIMML
tara:strand:- start:159 stop:500 length:342 start_codon:yes stop_codon:yes gene_type:complete